MWYTATVLPSSQCWDAVSSIDRSFVLCALIRVKAMWESHPQVPQLGAMSWEQCLGNGVSYQDRPPLEHLFSSFSIAYTHTLASPLHAHRVYHSCYESLQSNFWSLCWLVRNGHSWKRKEATSTFQEFHCVGSLSDIKQENIYSSQAMKARYYLCGLLVLNSVSSLEILQDMPRLTMTSSWISYCPILFLLSIAVAIYAVALLIFSSKSILPAL